MTWPDVAGQPLVAVSFNKMGSDSAQNERCPYSDPPYTELTDDHIFPQFLGGRRTIRVCRRCNNLFGHSFEGRASKQLKRLQVFISHFGLDLTKTPAIWPAAIVIGNETYDLKSGRDGAQYLLSKPTIVKDTDGRILGGKARSQSEANQISRGLIKSGQAKQVEITAGKDEPLDGVRLTAPFSFDQDLYRFATKMVASVLVQFDQQTLVTTSGIPAYLLGDGTWSTAPAYCDVSPILSLRPPLTHTVYVELGETSYGVVLIFGFMKLFVPLPASSTHRAFLATLDPITGEENFLSVAPIGPRAVPAYIQQKDAILQFREMNATLTRESIARGAKHPPDLEIQELDLGPRQAISWTDNTTRFVFPHTSKLGR